MEEKKSFFASLNPKSALIVGVVAGILILCTIGFLVMLGVYFGNKETSPTIAASNNDTIKPAPVSVTKSDRPKVELFVMSYCPYGLQMEKAYLPAWELLQNKADIDLKFVSYAMHGLKELEENTRQVCIQKEQPSKFISYLKCFTGKDDYKSCLAEVKITENSLVSCINATNKQFKILDKYNDKTTWLSGNYPLYPVNEDLNNQYGVQGSPTLVINGAQVDGVNRTAEAVKQAICAAFSNAPEECTQTLSNQAYSAGFGYEAGTANAAAECGP